MRLLEILQDGKFELRSFSDNIPSYAILSHVWAADNGEEVTFEDLLDGSGVQKPGFGKLTFCAAQAQKDGLKHFWVDTCCIKKSSDAELSKSLNSMYRWYSQSARCYVYLADVSHPESSMQVDLEQAPWRSAFKSSRWFQRGWTLQELIAPTSVQFFSKEGTFLCDKLAIAHFLSDITGISVGVLQGAPLSCVPIRERMSWMGQRQTKEPEDKAYALIGIVGTSMPVIYGEGHERALSRLEILAAEDTRRGAQLADWLSKADFPAYQSDLQDALVNGTGKWFLETQEFQTWFNTPGATLYCPGMPGAGKTMLVATTITHLFDHAGDAGVAYIYCRYKPQVQQTPTSLLAALLAQLVRARPSTRHHIEELKQQHNDRDTRPTIAQLINTLIAVITQHPTVYIVVDAYDECPRETQKPFLQALLDIHRTVPFHFMLTSRPIAKVGSYFSGPELEVKASDTDVKAFVSEEIAQLASCVTNDQEMRDLVLEQVTGAAEGMFLLAKLYMHALRDKRTKKTVKAVLHSISTRRSQAVDIRQVYDGAYHDIMQRLTTLPEEARSHTLKMLSWLIHTRAPLSSAELCHALAVEEDELELDPDNLPDLNEVITACAGLVIVDQTTNVVRMVHYTAQEYFDRAWREWMPDAKYLLAKTCLDYLNLDVDGDTKWSLEDDQASQWGIRHPFYAYTARWWYHHVESCHEQFPSLSNTFLADSQKVVNALITHEKIEFKHIPPTPKPYFAMHYVARAGLSNTLELLLQAMGDTWINEKNNHRATPLTLAIRSRSLETLKTVIRHGASTTPINNDGSLTEACKVGHEDGVRLLISEALRDDTATGFTDQASLSSTQEMRRALIIAASQGHANIVEYLLSQGVDVDCRVRDSGTALQAACFEGNVDMVKLLLFHGADPDAIAGTLPIYEYSYLTGTASLAAVTSGNETILKLIIEALAVVDHKGSNSLRAAVGAQNANHIRMLVANGADVNVDNGAIVVEAAATRNLDIMSLLIDLGVNVNASDHRGTALFVAVSKNDQDMAELLIKNGADTESGGPVSSFQYIVVAPTCTNIYMAAKRNYVSMLNLLLDHGANINHLDLSLGTALSVSIEEGHMKAAELLLARGADAKPSLFWSDPTLDRVAVLLEVADMTYSVGQEEVIPKQSGIPILDVNYARHDVLAIHWVHRDIFASVLERGAKMSELWLKPVDSSRAALECSGSTVDITFKQAVLDLLDGTITVLDVYMVQLEASFASKSKKRKSTVDLSKFLDIFKSRRSRYRFRLRHGPR